MSKSISLVLYDRESQEEALNMIQYFWFDHSRLELTMKDVLADLDEWTKPGNLFYFIVYQSKKVGFVHLGNRGNKIDWLEHLFVLPAFQKCGIGSRTIDIVENMVKTYSESMYIEVASRNMQAIKLYHRLGYHCLNTMTIRKDFVEEDFDVLHEEEIDGLSFEIRQKKGCSH